MRKQHAGRSLAALLKLVWRLNPRFAALLALQTLIDALKPVSAVLLPKLVLDELTGARRTPVLLMLAAAAAIASGALYLGGNLLRLRVERENLLLHRKCDAVLGDKSMRIGFQLLEDAGTMRLLNQARTGATPVGGLWGACDGLSKLLTSLLTGLGMLAMFRSPNPFVYALIALSVGVSLLCQKQGKKAKERFTRVMVNINRLFSYYYTTAMDFQNAKDLRMYQGQPLMMERLRTFNTDTYEAERANTKQIIRYGLLQTLVVNAQLGLLYALLVGQALGAGLEIGDLVLQAGAATGLSAALIQIFGHAADLMMIARLFAPFHEYMALPERRETQGRPVPSASPRIQFDRVTFTYPNAAQPALREVSFTLEPGRRLAVVGRNGAGKTTLIKLLTRLYTPDSGRILLDGVDIREYEWEAYLRKFAVVFQDFQLLAFSVRENVELDTPPDTPRLWEALGKAGLADKVNSLPKGLDTPVSRLFDGEGVEFSGGEKQKLAMARALYRQAAIVAMDEPTAALDPIAEAEVYTHMDKLIAGRSALYISHRLSACRFCDVIAVLEDGRLAQWGSHEELLRQTGPYAALFQAQAQYYA